MTKDETRLEERLRLAQARRDGEISQDELARALADDPPEHAGDSATEQRHHRFRGILLAVCAAACVASIAALLVLD